MNKNKKMLFLLAIFGLSSVNLSCGRLNSDVGAAGTTGASIASLWAYSDPTGTCASLLFGVGNGTCLIDARVTVFLDGSSWYSIEFDNNNGNGTGNTHSEYLVSPAKSNTVQFTSDSGNNYRLIGLLSGYFSRFSERWQHAREDLELEIFLIT